MQFGMKCICGDKIIWSNSVEEDGYSWDIVNDLADRVAHHGCTYSDTGRPGCVTSREEALERCGVQMWKVFPRQQGPFDPPQLGPPPARMLAGNAVPSHWVPMREGSDGVIPLASIPMPQPTRVRSESHWGDAPRGSARAAPRIIGAAPRKRLVEPPRTPSGSPPIRRRLEFLAAVAQRHDEPHADCRDNRGTKSDPPLADAASHSRDDYHGYDCEWRGSSSEWQWDYGSRDECQLPQRKKSGRDKSPRGYSYSRG